MLKKRKEEARAVVGDGEVLLAEPKQAERQMIQRLNISMRKMKQI